MLSDADRQILMAARLLPSAGNIFMGVGSPLVVGLVAKRRSPGLSAHVEAAMIGLNPQRGFGTIGDAGLVEGAENLISITEFFNYWLKKVEYSCAIMRALEVDERGTLNTCRTSSATLGGIGGAVAGAQCASTAVVLTSVGHISLVQQTRHPTHPLGDICKGDGKTVHVVTENAVFTRTASESNFKCSALALHGLNQDQIFQAWSPNSIGDVPVCEFSEAEIADLKTVRLLFDV